MRLKLIFRFRRPRRALIFGITLFAAVSAAALQRSVLSENSQYPSDKSLHADLHHHHAPQVDRVKQITESEIFSEFDVWSKKYVEGNLGHDGQQLKRGEYLADKRRELLKELVALNPKAALERAISKHASHRLPSSISAKLEQQVSGYGDLLVYVVMLHGNHQSHGEMTGSRIDREVVIGGSKYKAFVHGRRETMTTKLNIPLHGIVVDGLMAVAEDPVRRLERIEFDNLSAGRPILGDQNVAAEVGGKVVTFSNEAELKNFVQQQVEWEATIGPVRSTDNAALASSWTEGPKTVLFIRVDFPDKPGEPLDWNNQPLTIGRAQDLINNEINQFYIVNSYNKTSLQTTVTPVLRMPQSQSFYFTRVGDLFTDAKNAAVAAGFQLNSFNLDLIGMSHNSGFPYAGVASVGARGAALNGAFDLRVTVHELGHNYGLLHANLWQTTDGTPIGAGSNLEYGNPFDVMGGGFDARAHFNAKYKRRLDWLTDAHVQIVSGDGIYRVFAHDTSSLSGIRALKIRKNVTKNYWIEFRQRFTDNANAMNGAMINWDYLSRNFNESQLIDMTPNTFSTTDSPLLIGQSFFDDENRIRITVLGKGNTTPESLDVKVEFNVGCTFSLSQTSQNFSANGGEGSIPVNSLSGCRPQATSNESWLSAIASDTSPVRYIVAANYDSQPRTGTITVNGQSFTVQQAAATSVCVPRPAGMVAWWRGEGNALEQTGVNNGTLINNMSFGGGKVGGAFLGNFNENLGIVEVPDSPSLALNRSMTFEGWIKVSSYGGRIIERRDDMSSGNLASSYSVDIFPSGHLALMFGTNKTQGTGISSSQSIPLNQFVHFAASMDDATSQMKVYVNGVLSSQFTMTQRPYDLDPNARPRVNIGNINGLTDELAVYNSALSASEIQAIYNGGLAATGPAGKCLSAVPSAPVANPATNVSTVGFTANWSAATGATGYRLDVSNSNTFNTFISGHQDLDVGNALSRAVDGLNSATTYFYRVRAYNAGGMGNNSGGISVTTASAPAHDNFSDAQVIAGDSGTAMGTNVNATKQTGEPNHADNAGGKSVWYRWQASNDGIATFSTSGSNFNTLLAIYRGSSINSLSLVASNDDCASCGLTSRVSFAVVSGTTYQIAVDGHSGASGNITLNWVLTPTLQLSLSSYSVSEAGPAAVISVTRSGNTSGIATVNYVTSDIAGLQSCAIANGRASERCDYVTSVGALRFAPGESLKTFTIPVIDDVLLEANEVFTVSLGSTTGAFLGSTTTATVTIVDNDFLPSTSNPIDGIEYFIRQQYLDILNRQPDPTGLQNWINTLAPCPNGGFGEPPTSNCDRLHVAAGFFQSDEFLNRGYWAFRFYMVSQNQRPTYGQFIPDMAQVGGPKSPAEEEARKVAFAEAFVQRPEFVTRYGSLSGQNLANALLQTAGLPGSTFTVTGNLTNGQILRAIVETAAVFNRFLTEGTVSIQYFGFLRRDPDTIGYQNNVNTLNANPNNLRHMIFIFIYSTEYRRRFGP